VFASDTVEFSGFKITPENVRPSPAILCATSDFLTPKNLTDIQSWFGLVNQVTYVFSMTDKMLPFRELLKPKNTFHWDANLQNLFKQSKTKILDEIERGVKIFDKKKPTHQKPLPTILLRTPCTLPTQPTNVNKSPLTRESDDKSLSTPSNTATAPPDVLLSPK